MENLVKVNLHGEMGKVCKKTWDLNIESVSECIRAIEANTHKLYKFLWEKDKIGVTYRVLVNGEDFECEKKGKLGLDDIEIAKNSGLTLKRGNLKTIDIIPVLEGADSKTMGIVTIIAGAILILIGTGLLFPSLGGSAPLILIGIGLIGAGVMVLLTQSPQFAAYRQAPDGEISYLFNGPTNTTKEGGPVPVGYGTLLIGSQVISEAYANLDYSIPDDKTKIGSVVKNPFAKTSKNTTTANASVNHINPGEIRNLIINRYGNTN